MTTISAVLPKLSSMLTTLADSLRAGKMPTSAQIEKMMQALLKSDLLQPDAAARVTGHRMVGGNARLSKKGRDVVVSFRQVLESLLRVGLEKNADDKIQRFIWACAHASADVNVDVGTSFRILDALARG